MDTSTRHRGETRPSWHRQAPCASSDPDTWFPQLGDAATAAKKICAACPYKAPCLLDAIERREQHGIWGGVNARRFTQVRAELGMDVPAKASETHCVHGHEWAAGNTYVRANGKRACRACNVDQLAKSRARKRVAA